MCFCINIFLERITRLWDEDQAMVQKLADDCFNITSITHRFYDLMGIT